MCIVLYYYLINIFYICKIWLIVNIYLIIIHLKLDNRFTYVFSVKIHMIYSKNE
jgi:hypothetical protein